MCGSTFAFCQTTDCAQPYRAEFYSDVVGRGARSNLVPSPHLVESSLGKSRRGLEYAEVAQMSEHY